MPLGSRDHRLRLLYLGLACGITWALVLPLVVQARLGVPLGVPDWWHALGALGPVVAAGIAIRKAGTCNGISCWASECNHWRVSWRWWVIAVTTPLLGFAIAILASIPFRQGTIWNADALARAWQSPYWRWQLLVTGTMAYGLLGEPGWRGFLLPSLRQSHGPLGATLRLWPLWALWHAPFFFYHFAMSASQVAVWLAGLLAASIVLTWLVEMSGSVLVAAVCHAMGNAALLIAMVAAPAAVVAGQLLLGTLAFGIALYWWMLPRRAELDRRARARLVPETPPMGTKRVIVAQ